MGGAPPAGGMPPPGALPPYIFCRSAAFSAGGRTTCPVAPASGGPAVGTGAAGGGPRIAWIGPGAMPRMPLSGGPGGGGGIAGGCDRCASMAAIGDAPPARGMCSFAAMFVSPGLRGREKQADQVLRRRQHRARQVHRALIRRRRAEWIGLRRKAHRRTARRGGRRAIEPTTVTEIA
jgi:hypothetical protein